MGDTVALDDGFCPSCGGEVDMAMAIIVPDGVPDAYLGVFGSDREQTWIEDGDERTRPATHVTIEPGEVRVHIHTDPAEDRTI